MRVKSLMKLAMLVPALSLGVLTAHAQQSQSQQSSGDAVADAARKAREQKKDAPKPKKVFTDDDVKPASSAETQPAGNAAASGSQGSGEAAKSGDANGAAGGETSGGKNDEATWRKKFKEQRDKIAQAEKELDLLEREGDKAQVQYYSDPQKALNEQLTRKDINDHNSKVEDKKKQIAQLKQQMDDMEDALRKSGGDPGWAR